MLFIFKAIQHLLHQVINVQQLQLHIRVIHLDRQVVRNVIAERSHCAVVVWSAPLSKQIREPVYQHLCPRLFLIFQEQVFPCFLRAAVLTIAEASSQRSLLRRRQHHRASVPILLQRIQQRRSKAEVPFHKLRSLLRSVHTRKVKHEVTFLTPLIQQCRISINVILIHLFYPLAPLAIRRGVGGEVWTRPVLPLFDIIKVSAKVPTHEPFCTSHQYFHNEGTRITPNEYRGLLHEESCQGLPE